MVDEGKPVSDKGHFVARIRGMQSEARDLFARLDELEAKLEPYSVQKPENEKQGTESGQLKCEFENELDNLYSDLKVLGSRIEDITENFQG